ncbi:hypothetical protein [Agrobacterium sp. LAD9]|uniref:hypothetical protein n=1 Tax=Agrobacterium sp. LAD9 TaxID=2055153 RepID=UPI000D1ECCA8|nr:hypothetical protein [Agrobacterium sp. LAD9]
MSVSVTACVFVINPPRDWPKSWTSAPVNAAANQIFARVFDHNAVQHDFLLHLLLFISRSSGTLRSMICPGR